MQQALIAASAAGALIAMWVIKAVSGFARLRRLAGEGWSAVDSLLRKRAELVPALIAASRGLPGAEDAATGAWAALASVLSADAEEDNLEERMAAENELSAALVPLIGAASRAEEEGGEDAAGLSRIMGELRGIGGELWLARLYYNGMANRLNIAVRAFPGVIAAAVFGYGCAPFFDGDDVAAAPQRGGAEQEECSA